QIAVEVEQMRFEQELAAVHGRARAEAGDRGPVVQAGAGHAHRVDAVDRRQAPAERDVRGRITERAPEFLAVDDTPGDREVAAEQTARQGVVAGEQRGTDARARDAL